MKWLNRSTGDLSGRAVGCMVDLMVPSRLHLAWIMVNQTRTPIFAVMRTEVINGKLWLDCIDLQQCAIVQSTKWQRVNRQIVRLPSKTLRDRGHSGSSTQCQERSCSFRSNVLWSMRADLNQLSLWRMFGSATPIWASGSKGERDESMSHTNAVHAGTRLSGAIGRCGADCSANISGRPGRL